jgi:signal transduction histidine kinase
MTTYEIGNEGPDTDVSRVLAPLTRDFPYNKNGGKISFGDATVHELKTLLTAIVVSAELLSEELQSSQELMPQRLAQNIVRNAHNLDEKLANFSEMAGLLSGKLPFEPELLQIGPVIHDISSQVYPIIHSRNQSLNVDLPSVLPQVSAQRHYLEQILLNLVTNASKFTPELGNITVSAAKNGSSLIIEVSDNGIGIPMDKQEMVFEPYYQVASGNGSGLGLAITKFLVELHGGTIWLESISGKGSRFFFSLPLSDRR